MREQLHRQNLTKHSSCKHDTGVREIRVALTLIIGAYDEARIHNSQVFEPGILGHDGPYDGKIDIRSSQLAFGKLRANGLAAFRGVLTPS